MCGTRRAWSGRSPAASATAAADVLPLSRLGEGIGYSGLGQAIAMSIGPALAIFLISTDVPENFYFGLAGCSADCDTMWQIGVDVLPAYRRQGIACALTSRLALEILARGKAPFYCAAWSNLASVRNAIRSGFLPAWAELTVKPEAFVREMNGQEPRQEAH